MFMKLTMDSFPTMDTANEAALLLQINYIQIVSFIGNVNNKWVFYKSSPLWQSHHHD